ncbi:MAG TPA: ComF family protein [Patescibacteria group bacterium]|nr:ComF family protein [Patescibacteria group bacterium]
MNILDFLFPKRCLGCGRIGKYFCNKCRETIRVVENNEAICPMCERPAIDGVTHPRCQTRYAIDGLTSAFHYDGIIRKAVKAIKYHHIFDISRELVSFMPATILQASVMIPIPLFPSRQKERGYNQAEIVGRLLSESLHIPLRTDILKRIKKTIPQVEIKKRDARLKNMEGVFATCRMSPKRVILFDDVFTTGATMRSAANVLKRNGAKWVWAMTIAR